MNLEPFADESAFIQSTNIFEWTPGEKRLRQHHNKTGFEAILEILDGLGYYGYIIYWIYNTIEFDFIEKKSLILLGSLLVDYHGVLVISNQNIIIILLFLKECLLDRKSPYLNILLVVCESNHFIMCF